VTEQPVVTGIPIVTGRDGQPYIGTDAAVALLRALAETCQRMVTSPERAADFVRAIRFEADALEVRAIAHTT
jgi:hypothetical protein